MDKNTFISQTDFFSSISPLVLSFKSSACRHTVLFPRDVFNASCILSNTFETQPIKHTLCPWLCVHGASDVCDEPYETFTSCYHKHRGCFRRVQVCLGVDLGLFLHPYAVFSVHVMYSVLLGIAVYWHKAVML